MVSDRSNGRLPMGRPFQTAWFLEVFRATFIRTRRLVGTALIVIFAGLKMCSATSVGATSYTVEWLNMGNVSSGATVVNGTVFRLPGYGNVRVNLSTTPGI